MATLKYNAKSLKLLKVGAKKHTQYSFLRDNISVRPSNLDHVVSAIYEDIETISSSLGVTQSFLSLTDTPSSYASANNLITGVDSLGQEIEYKNWAISGNSIYSNAAGGSIGIGGKGVGKLYFDVSGNIDFEGDLELLSDGSQVAVIKATSGYLGLGVVAPVESIHTVGGIKIGDAAQASQGTIRYTANDFEGYDGSNWVSFTQTNGNYFDKGVDTSDNITEGLINLFMDTSEQAKLGFITVTQNVDLDQMEIDILANNAKVSNVSTDLSLGPISGTAMDVNSSDGTNVTLPIADATFAGLMSAADKSKLDGVEANATADQTDLEIKTAYENNANTNEFSDLEKAKLASLDDSKFLGEYIDLTALQTAHPSPIKGSYANVDAGIGNDVIRYVWDYSDNVYIEQLGVSTLLTDAQIKTQYENNANTNVYTDTEKTKVSHLSVTQAVDLDTMESDTATNNAKISADGSINTHSDVDTTTSAPSIGEALIWDGSNWIPDSTGGTDTNLGTDNLTLSDPTRTYNIDGNELIFLDGINHKLKVTSTGVGIGNVGIPTASLEIKGVGATSGTSALLVENSSGTDLLEVKDDGTILGAFPVGGGSGTDSFQTNGVLSNASGLDSLALGKSAKALTNYAIAIGSGANANTLTDTIAMGRDSNASGSFSVGIGLKAISSGLQTVALGARMNATASNSIMIGGSAALPRTNSNANSVEFNFNETTSTIRLAKSVDSFINTSANFGIGNAAPSAKLHVTGTVRLDNSAVVGHVLTATSNDGTATWQEFTSFGTEEGSGVGSLEQVNGGANASGISAVALSRGAIASSDYAIAIGDGATASTAFDTISLGRISSATGLQSITVGIGSSSTGDRSLAIGQKMIASATNSIMIGGATPSAKTNSTANSLEVNFNETTSTIRLGKSVDSWINTSANFGIGTNTPLAKLHVNGDIRIDDTTATGKTISTDFLPINVNGTVRYVALYD